MSNPTLQGIKQRFGIIGANPDLDRALSRAMRVAPTDLTVLITGESGVGKEVFSKVIHGLSARKHNPFIAVNCGAIPMGTINSELFGHEKGAFTGATSDRKGYFETANTGTIFLDEIGEMPLDTQAFLLRVLESGEFMRVGSSQVNHTDVRVIAATNVDLQNQVKKGKFREDLYFRLNTVPIHVPALRDRRDDIPILFRKFTVDFGERYRTPPIRLDEKATQLLKQYDWPGNIRELRNVAEQATVLSEKKELDAQDLLIIAPQLMQQSRLPVKLDAPNGGQSMEEREILYKLLFDMKNDLNDLKNVVHGLIQANDLDIADGVSLAKIIDASNVRSSARDAITRRHEEDFDITHISDENAPSDHHDYDEAEVVDDNLSLAEMEKLFIIKALDKHGGKRRDAAKELGISERTLYRKIKEYDIL